MVNQEDLERLKEVFVTRQENQSQSDEFENKLSQGLIKFAVIETKLSQITWVLTAVGGGVITMLIKMFFDP